MRALSHARLLSVSLGLCVVFAPMSSGHAQDNRYRFEREPTRWALVIGNSEYRHLTRIPSSTLDATEVKQRLEKLGFKVTPVLDLSTVDAFEDDVLSKFRKPIEAGDLVVFYFSGHGFSYGPHSFVAPTEMPLTLKDRDLPRAAIAIETVEDYLISRLPGLLLFVIDACRTFGSFRVDSTSNANAVAKGGYSEPKRFHRRSNSLMAFAARPGYVAEGSAAFGTLSVFTGNLVKHISKDGAEFGNLFNDVSADVSIETKEAQQPGLFDWSDTELYLLPSEAIRTGQKELWFAALDSNKRDNVLRYNYRYSLSRHAAAARKWLDENALAPAPAFTAASPAAVERLWRPGQSRLAITPAIEGFAFERSLDSRTMASLESLDDHELGLLPSGARPALPSAKSIDRYLQTAKVHGTIVATKDYLARTAPSPSADVAFRVPFGTKMRIEDISDAGAKGKWLAAEIPGRDELFYVPVSPARNRVAPIELGSALQEIVVRPQRIGVRDMVEPDQITRIIATFKAFGRTITWVSLAAARTDDRRETDARALRLAHAEYLLKRAGVDGRRITAVEAADDLSGDGIRIRFFGF